MRLVLPSPSALRARYSMVQLLQSTTGGPNSNSKPTDELIHHSLGEIRYDFVRKIYAQITATAIVVKHAREAAMQIHDAISICLRYVSSNRPTNEFSGCGVSWLKG